MGGWGWGWGDGWMGVGVVGGYPTHTCTRMHMHARTHTHAHVRMVNMIISCKWLPPLGESLRFPYDVIRARRVCMHACMCVHVRACARVWGAPSHHPPPTSAHPPTPPGGTPGISQNSIALELMEIFQFHLKI